MLPEDEYRALKRAHLELQRRPPIPEPVNYYKLSIYDNSSQVFSSTWSDSTASEVGGFSVLTNLKKGSSKGRRTRLAPGVKGRLAGFSPSKSNQSAVGPNNLIYPNVETHFGGFDPATYKAAQALGHGSIYGSEALLRDERSSLQQQTRQRSVRHTQGRSSTGSDIKTWTYQQPHGQPFHNSENTEGTELNRSPTVNLLAFAEPTQAVSHDPSMPTNLGPEHTQYWASRQAAMGKVLAPQDQLSSRCYHCMNTSEGFFVPKRTEHQQYHGAVYEGLLNRAQAVTPPRKKRGVFKRFWKKIICGSEG